jgi:hypothetical protein
MEFSRLAMISCATGFIPKNQSFENQYHQLEKMLKFYNLKPNNAKFFPLNINGSIKMHRLNAKMCSDISGELLGFSKFSKVALLNVSCYNENDNRYSEVQFELNDCLNPTFIKLTCIINCMHALRNKRNLNDYYSIFKQ